MSPSHDGTLRLAIERVRWALGVPMRYAEDDWDGRRSRALAFLEDALQRHARLVEPILAEAVDAGQLPFTPLSRSAGELLDDHGQFRRQVASLLAELTSQPSLYAAYYSRARTDLFGHKEPREAASIRLPALCRETRELLQAIEQLVLADAEV
jgi:hypothetical protein